MASGVAGRAEPTLGFALLLLCARYGPRVVARSFSAGVAIRYVFPVL